MTEHPGAAHPRSGSTGNPGSLAVGHDREVSARIYDYIRTGRLDQRDHHGERPTPPSART